MRNPNRCPKNTTSTPKWNRFEPQRNSPRRKSCDESLFHVYWSRSKRIRLPTKNTVSAMYG